MSREIPLVNSDKKAIVDDEDYERISKYEWFLDGETGYAARIENMKLIFMQEDVLGIDAQRYVMGIN
ncbi:MAG TPA: hypothetical protein VGE97_05700 [Nitrososphaera sp.]|jgi:hypothetical protein